MVALETVWGLRLRSVAGFLIARYFLIKGVAMNTLLTILGVILGGGIAYAPAAILIRLSNNSDEKRAKVYKGIGSVYLIVLWIPLTIFLSAEFITRLTNG